jgi:acyl dehydratase
MAQERIANGNVGDKFVGGSRVITRTELDLFCTICGLRLDPFLIDESAQEIGFKAIVIPGPMQFSLVFGLLGDLIQDLVHVGTEKLKVLLPVYVNERVHVETEIIEKKGSSEGRRRFVTWSWALKKEDGAVSIQGVNT